ncbi:MAG: metalloregulator ArsR/SmtB family transcription factor [Vicinamibacterales bacterium]
MNQASGILDRLGALTDPMRSRILTVLEVQELTVGELCTVFQLPQSTVSRHLKTLSDEGWLTSRREGTSRFYSMDLASLDEPMRRMWPVVRDEMAKSAFALEDRRQVEQVLGERRSKSQAFFSTAASDWDRLREDLYGSTMHLRALGALVDERWQVGDFGCGTGVLAEALAPFVRRLVAVDTSDRMLDVARTRLRRFPHVDVRQGDLESLPLGEGELDAAVMLLVLHHIPMPNRALAEAFRVLRPGGLFVIVDMCAHDQEEYRTQMGHVWLGFDPVETQRGLEGLGFESAGVHLLPADPKAKGPALFLARARKPPSNVLST